MLTFKQYLITEKKRNPKEVRSLASKILSRYQKQTKSSRTDVPIINSLPRGSQERTDIIQKLNSLTDDSWNNKPVKYLSTKEILHAQDTINIDPNTVELKLKEPMNRPISVVKHKGIHYALDGNHTLAKHKALGSDTVPVKILDLDRKKSIISKLKQYVQIKES